MAKQTLTYLVAGQGAWGKGPTLAAAKAEFRKQGGSTKKGTRYGYFVYTCTSDKVRVNEFGNIAYPQGETLKEIDPIAEHYETCGGMGQGKPKVQS